LRFVYLDDLAAQDFLLRDGDLLIALLAWHGAGEQLPGTLAREDDEFEAIFLGWSFHVFSLWAGLTPLLRAGLNTRPYTVFTYDVDGVRNVSMMVSAAFRIIFTRDRSASTMAPNRSTAVSSSSLTTTYS